MISKHLIGRKISHREISNANKELAEAVEKWRMRELSREPIKCVFVGGRKRREDPGDGRYWGHRVKTLNSFRLPGGGKESATTWREFFKNLKIWGLRADRLILGIMDGFTGLESFKRGILQF